MHFSHKSVIITILLVAAISIAFIPQQVSYAATLTVNVTGITTDTPDADGICSLIDAIQEANTTGTESADCGLGDAGADTIVLVGDVTLDGSVTFGASGLPSITSNITIQGAGFTIERQWATCDLTDADPDFRILHVSVGGNLSLYDLTVQNGCANAGGGIYNTGTISTIANTTIASNSAINSGGGIYNTGTISTIANTTIASNSAINDNGGGIYNIGTINTIANSAFSGNSADFFGGGICNANTINRIANSTFAGNSSTTNGGGIYNLMSTPTTIANSTFFGNSVNFAGGGIYNYISGNSTITNTTVSGNAASAGGGIYNWRTLTNITNTTVSGNTVVSTGGGIYNGGSVTDSGVININNSIVTGNTNGDCRAGSNSIYNGDYNRDSDSSCPGGNTTNLSAGSLGPLADNGGATRTHALLVGSNAIDTGDNTICAGASVNNADQRGAARPVNGGIGVACDIGAVEYNGLPPTVTFTLSPITIYETGGVTMATARINTTNHVDGNNIDVYFAISGTATDGSDFTVTGSTTPTFAPGSGAQAFTIGAFLDALPDDGETVTLTMYFIGAASQVGTNPQTLTIVDGVPVVVPPTPSEPEISVFDPAISKMGLLSTGQVGVTDEVLEWVVTVSNVGNMVGNNVVVTDTLVDNLQIDRVDAPRAIVNISGQTVTVTYAMINPGEMFRFSIFTTVLDGTAVANTVCVDDPTWPSGKECTTALPIHVLPSTGEVPGN